MKQANKTVWTLVLSGIERIDASKAFRGTRWGETWHDRASSLDDTDYDAGLIVSIDIQDLTHLVDLLKVVGDLKPAYGIQLCVSSEFDSVNVNCNLCTEGQWYQEASGTMTQNANVMFDVADGKLNEIDRLLHDVRMLMAVKPQ